MNNVQVEAMNELVEAQAKIVEMQRSNGKACSCVYLFV